MNNQDFYIGEDNFRVWLPSVQFLEKAEKEDAYNSRQMVGIMSTSRKDRQGENVLAKGLEISQFLKAGHFNDNHDQSTSAIVGYPEEAIYKSEIELPDGSVSDGYICRGYVLKGTKRADGIWELAKALQNTPKRLGFSIEGKVARRNNKIIEKAIIRNVAITNCPVNTDATWSILEKSFYQEDVAMTSLSAGYATSPAGQSNGGALRVESLDSDEKDMNNKRKKKKDALERALGIDDLLKAMDTIMERSKDYDEEMAAKVVTLIMQGKL